jgi:putative membrane protein
MHCERCFTHKCSVLNAYLNCKTPFNLFTQRRITSKDVNERGCAVMGSEAHLSRGIAAGVIGGIVASWIMNEFMKGPGRRLQQAIQSPEENERQAIESETPREDATMKTADAVVSTVTGGEHLTWKQRQKAGPIVHYAFGGMVGAVYGGLAEIWPGIRGGCGTTFGAILFTGADLIAVPVLNLGPSPEDQPATAQAAPLAAHLVYGVATELVRWTARALL